MENITIPRDLAERVATELTRLSDLVCGIDQEIIEAVYQDVRAALTAPAVPLTAEDCRQIAKRLRNVRHTNEVRATGRRCMVFGSADQAASVIDNIADLIQAEEIAANAPA